ncbi:MAG TPA: cytochrome P450 [Solirubrobacteraceae bacterium]|nr:cytochrome P450 [Solirubrobacteraceae bacterium]
MATASSSVSSSAAASALPPTASGPGLPPGPRAPALVQTLAWALAPTWLMDRCAARLGDAFTLTFAPSGLKLVLISDPQAVKDIFTASPEVAPSAANASPIASVLGPSSVLIQTGAEHMRQRKLLLPPFHGERMREYEQVIVQETRRDIEGWPLGRPLRMLPRTRAITLEVILRAVFGVEAERMGPLRGAIGALLAPMHTVTLLRQALRRPGPGRPGGAIGRALERLDAVVYEEIRVRRAQSDLGARADILSLLLQARDEQGREMTDGELRDELVTLLLAGHETTATSVAWALERLVRHPDKLARLSAEIDAGEGEEYLVAVVNETLRVRPVVPIVVRLLMDELRVGERALPAGTRVVPSIYLVNRNPRVNDAPTEFRPERFLGEAPETFSWIPFGGGIRRCIGASFAQLEMKLMLATMLSELVPRAPSRTIWRRGELVRRRAITLVPADGASVVWEGRGRG